MRMRVVPVVLALGLLAAPAEASVVVIGGGVMAEKCSRAALAGEFDVQSQEACSFSLQNENLGIRDLAGTYVNRGVMRMRALAFADALKDFDEAQRLHPRMGETYINRGAIRIAQRRYAEGLADIDRGLALKLREPAKAYFNRALAHEGLDDLKAAYQDFKTAEQLDPEWEAPRRELERYTVSTR